MRLVERVGLGLYRISKSDQWSQLPNVCCYCRTCLSRLFDERFVPLLRFIIASLNLYSEQNDPNKIENYQRQKTSMLHQCNKNEQFCLQTIENRKNFRNQMKLNQKFKKLINQFRKLEESRLILSNKAMTVYLSIYKWKQDRLIYQRLTNQPIKQFRTAGKNILQKRLKKPKDFPLGQLFNPQHVHKAGSFQQPPVPRQQRVVRAVSIPTMPAQQKPPKPAQQKPSLRCKNGHSLALVSVLPSLYVNQQYKCDSCYAQMLVDQVPSYHCSKCKYDICLKCAGKALKRPATEKAGRENQKVGGKQQQPQQPQQPQQQQQQLQHQHSHSQGNLHTNPVITNIALILAQESMLPTAGLMGPFCRNHHQLQLIYALPMQYGGMYSCDICKMNKAVSQQPSWHCDYCIFDVCRTCMKM